MRHRGLQTFQGDRQFKALVPILGLMRRFESRPLQKSLNIYVFFTQDLTAYPGEVLCRTTPQITLVSLLCTWSPQAREFRRSLNHLINLVY